MDFEGKMIIAPHLFLAQNHMSIIDVLARRTLNDRRRLGMIVESRNLECCRRRCSGARKQTPALNEQSEAHCDSPGSRQALALRLPPALSTLTSMWCWDLGQDARGGTHTSFKINRSHKGLVDIVPSFESVTLIKVNFKSHLYSALNMDPTNF